MRYHFNVRDGLNIFDEDGQELPDDAAARREALRASADMLRDWIAKANWGDDEWLMDISDENGRKVSSLKIVRRVE